MPLYPPIEPYQVGMLAVGCGHEIYYEVSGNPDGKPVVCLHGGPGSGSHPSTRQFFDRERYCIIQFDQRNCGNSTPHASDPDIDLSTNTTHHLIEDIEALRHHLNIKQWMLFGVSWGSTLALAYAQAHPQHVTDILLVGVTMTRQSEIDWLYEGLKAPYPQQWYDFFNHIPETLQQLKPIDAYHHLLNVQEDLAVRTAAAKIFHEWEWASVSVDPAAQPSGRWLDPKFQLARARICTHYFHHQAWLSGDSLLENAHKLSDIRGILINGRLDLMSPLITAWDLHQVWANSDLVIVENAGHSTGDGGMAEAITTATKRLSQ